MILNFEKAHVLIIGDVMLDRYMFGGTHRISPEAPVPVVHVSRIDERPGGAANVALGVAAVGANPYLLGLLGSDTAASILENLLSKHAVHYEFVKNPEYDTITKLRVLSRNQQMIRLDTEKHFTEFPNTAMLTEKYHRALEKVNMVVLSDYGKGTLSNSLELIMAARAKNIPVIVDPKSSDFSHYRGASVITPNLKEFEAVVGSCASVDIMIEKAFRLLSKYQIDALVITRSEHGMSVIESNQRVTHIPTVAREVHDVTGAGDTVVAVLAAALASGMDLSEAATLGNCAAGIAVSKLGTATVSKQELEASLGKEKTGITGIMDEESLLELVHLCKFHGEKIVFTNGCFDILHSGHVAYLEQAKSLGDRVIVAVNTDDSVSRLKGPHRPINSLENRMKVLAGLRSVDWVVPFAEDTPERMIQKISPDTLVKGGDYQDIESLPGARFVLSQGGDVKILGVREGCSTTRIIEAIVHKHDVSLFTEV